MIARPPNPGPTIWGLTPTQIHDRFWAARGVQVVRPAQDEDLSHTAELFLLIPAGVLTLFELRPLVDLFTQLDPLLIRLRLLDESHPPYRERLFAAPDGRFERFERDYASASASDTCRVALTPSRDVAGNWRALPGAGPAEWRTFTRLVPRRQRLAVRRRGAFVDAGDPAEAAAFVHRLPALWPRPDGVIPGLRRAGQLWVREADPAPAPDRVIGPIWLGAGRGLPPGGAAIGPAVVWDDPDHRPEPPALRWFDIEPGPGAAHDQEVHAPAPHATSAGKRLFDLAFAAAVLLLTLPLYPLIMLAILIEDGRPWFFVHRRETIGGREFGCIKFRTMRKDADRIKAEIIAQNQADGPQFYIADDPRITRVGKLLRKLQIDELPQFLNVLAGAMSVVGPRPSPFSENQYNPAWREARLSVRPGVTGLWQVRRTRAAGTDFQEWIRYDIDYVERASWALDLKIILDTIRLVLRPILRR